MQWSSRDGKAGWAACAATRAVAAVLTLSVGWPVAAGAQANPATGRITALAVSPPDGALWVGAAQGLFRSSDQGRTLTAVTLPRKATPPDVTAVVVELRVPGAVYVATGGEGVFKSEDGGRSWAAASDGLVGPDVRGLSLAPEDGRLHAHVRGKGLFRSFDGARSWERVDVGPAGTMHSLVSVNLPTGMGGIFLYAATDQGLVRGPD
ncbi:MAG: WD40/YVTN/BNR-like repeat-containing protein [Candidatus Rokuibacteriota bacterium]